MQDRYFNRNIPSTKEQEKENFFQGKEYYSNKPLLDYRRKSLNCQSHRNLFFHSNYDEADNLRIKSIDDTNIFKSKMKNIHINYDDLIEILYSKNNQKKEFIDIQEHNSEDYNSSEIIDKTNLDSENTRELHEEITNTISNSEKNNDSLNNSISSNSSNIISNYRRNHSKSKDKKNSVYSDASYTFNLKYPESCLHINNNMRSDSLCGTSKLEGNVSNAKIFLNNLKNLKFKSNLRNPANLSLDDESDGELKYRHENSSNYLNFEHESKKNLSKDKKEANKKFICLKKNYKIDDDLYNDLKKTKSNNLEDTFIYKKARGYQDEIKYNKFKTDTQLFQINATLDVFNKININDYENLQLETNNLIKKNGLNLEINSKQYEGKNLLFSLIKNYSFTY